jgi:PTH1 family peptidyl-tRNA hydrolase
MIRLVVFLGNPGKTYAATRHNLAWLLLERLSFYEELSWKSKFRGEYAQRVFGEIRVVLLKPLAFMNRSGGCVREAVTFYKMSAEEILVVHDEVELEFGERRFKWGGGLGGHNGLRSISASLGTREFCRFRLGIGRPNRGDISSYVLGGFSPKQRDDLPLFLDSAAQELEAILPAGPPQPV